MTALPFPIVYNNPANFTFDPLLAEITTKALLKILTYTDETFYADFRDTIAGRRGAGSMTIVPNGAAAILANWLELGNNSIGYVDIDANLNADSQQVGCIRWDYRPNYNVGPIVENRLFSLCRAAGDNRNDIYIRHRDAASLGDLRLHAYDQVGALIEEKGLGVWGTTLGNIHNLELNFDYTAGATRFFIDGVQKGTTALGAGVRDANIGLLRFGSDFTGTRPSQGAIRRVQYFSTVQHTADFTPADEPITYSVVNPFVVVNVGREAKGLASISAAITAAGLDQVRGILLLGVIQYWFNGIAWAISTGYAESNTIAELEINKASFIFAEKELKLGVYLHSETGYTTPEIIRADLTYDFDFIPTIPNECIVYGVVRDSFGKPVEGAIVTAKPATWYYNEARIVNSKSHTTLADGKWELSLVENATHGGTYDFITQYTTTEGKTKKKSDKGVIVPNEETKAIDIIV